MFVRITTDPASRPNTLGALGMESGSNPIVSLSEFNYKKGTEIFGEKEPAEYVYQVKVGNYMGQNFGVIIGIGDGDIRLKELVQDGAGDWTERTSTLQLAEADTRQERRR